MKLIQIGLWVPKVNLNLLRPQLYTWPKQQQVYNNYITQVACDKSRLLYTILIAVLTCYQRSLSARKEALNGTRCSTFRNSNENLPVNTPRSFVTLSDNQEPSPIYYIGSCLWCWRATKDRSEHKRKHQMVQDVAPSAIVRKPLTVKTPSQLICIPFYNTEIKRIFG